MNKIEYKIISHALETLNENAGISGEWKATPLDSTDGKVTFEIEGEILEFDAVIKDTVRNYQLSMILEGNKNQAPLIVVGRHIFPKIKQALRDAEIAYLEGNGNIFLKRNGILLWLDGQKSLPAKTEKGNRAFTKTGLKVLYHFLKDPDLLNLTYREIAKVSGVALGNVNYIVTGLKQLYFIVSIDGKRLILNNKKQLLQKWIAAYEERLKPVLFIGSFRFVRKEDFVNWKKIELNKEKTVWGAEPAGEILTHYLHPAELTMYTTETKTELMKNYKLIPDEKGAIKVYRKFWQDTTDTDTAAPILVYADLMNTGDRRCLETAQKIYNDYLQNQFESNKMG